jgi:hypothetical protein
MKRTPAAESMPTIVHTPAIAGMMPTTTGLPEKAKMSATAETPVNQEIQQLQDQKKTARIPGTTGMPARAGTSAQHSNHINNISKEACCCKDICNVRNASNFKYFRFFP